MDVISLKNDVYKLVQNGSTSKEVIDRFVGADGEIFPKECELWDFKEDLEDSNDAHIKMLKTILSFHNTYGGYIIYGIKEVQKDKKFQIEGIAKEKINLQNIRGKFDKYVSKRIDVTFTEHRFHIDGNEKIVGLLHIPKRLKNEHTLAPYTTANSSKNEIILAKDAVYIRKVDVSTQAVSQEEFEFLMGEREFGVSTTRVRKNIIEHNLPDKNFICPKFIGRFEIIQELWSWLSDDFQYAKVLAADGGKGKTSIAYEFCQLLISSGSNLFDQVIWLTAKKKQFKASHNVYIPTPETHFNDIDSLLKEICLRTGFLVSEISDFNFQQLQRSAREGLNALRSLIVIDDIDSTSTEEQRRIMEVARVIANGKSRILITTRVNDIYSSDSSIMVPGLKGKDYRELIGSLCKSLNIPTYSDKNIQKLEKASEGSPLYTESILRVCKLGKGLDAAILEWDGKAGDTVREAALRKEVSELSPETIKLLVTVSYVGSASRTELHKYTDLENSEIDYSIEKLNSLFLLNGKELIEGEPRFETSSSISKLVLSIVNEILPNGNDFLERVKEISQGLEENGLSNISEIGAAIRQCNSLILEHRFSDARDTVKNLLKRPRFKENSDLYFMLAKTQYEDPTTDDEAARNSFSEAFIKGQRKPAFFEMWYQLEIKSGSKKHVLDVCDYALIHVQSEHLHWRKRFSYASFDMAKISVRFERKIEYAAQAYQSATLVMPFAEKSTWHSLKELCVEIVEFIWSTSIEKDQLEIATTAVINAIEKGDIRRPNFSRIIDVVTAQLQNQTVSTEFLYKLKDCLYFSAVRVKDSAYGDSREVLAEQLMQLHQQLAEKLSSK